jgi:uncharacterized protein YndB with AHSA1/START domain
MNQGRSEKMNTDQKELRIELRSETEVVIRRYFAAPRKLVFDCHTQPELMRRWLIGPPGMVLDIREHDLRAGGKYLYVYADSKGNGMGVYGKFLEVTQPEKVSNTENYAMDLSAFNPNAPEDPAATVESRTFITEGDLTLVTHVSKYASAEVRKMVLDSGATDGWAACYLELDKLLSEIK